MFVVVVAVVVVFLCVSACIRMHSGPCSPVLPGSVGKNSKVSFPLPFLRFCLW